MVLKSMLLFLLAALPEIGGAWLVWRGVREPKGWVWIGTGVIALGLYGFVAILQPDARLALTAWKVESPLCPIEAGGSAVESIAKTRAVAAHQPGHR